MRMAFEISLGVAVKIFFVVEAPSTSYLGDLSNPDYKCWPMDHIVADFGLDAQWLWHFPIPHSLSIECIFQRGVLV